MGYKFSVFLLLSLLYSSQGAYSTTCSSVCDEAYGYQFESGYNYLYQFDLHTQMELNKINEEKSWIRISGQANIQSLGQCDHVLRLSQVQISDSDSNTNSDSVNQFQTALQQNPLVFPLNNGKISHLCPSKDENNWVLNIKRAIISSFQNSLPNQRQNGNIVENDIIGQCMTEYQLVERGRERKVIKRKDLTKCTKRTSYIGLLQSSTYDQQELMGPQNLPLLKSQYECSQSFKSERLTQVKCTEWHLFKPFSSSNGAGAKATSTLQINYKSANRANAAKPDFGDLLQRSLLFDATGQDIGPNAESDATISLQELCKISESGVKPEGAQTFYRLGRSLESVSDLYSWYQQSSNTCPEAKKIILQGLNKIHTGAALKIVKSMINEGLLNKDEKNNWYTSLAFAKHMDTNTLIQAIDLIDSGDQLAILSAGTLINLYCNTNKFCDQTNGVQTLVAKLESPFGNGCHVTEANHEQVLLHLKALGNGGQILTKSISQCFINQQNPTEIRVAAIEALRRVSCDVDRSNLFEVFDHESDAEIAISAYFGLMQCALPGTIDRIIEHLNRMAAKNIEDITGNLVYSHLSQLQVTNDPQKQHLRSLVENEILPNHFESSSMSAKLNQYKEFGKFWPEMNSGFFADAYAIFADNSYAPRKAALNFTVDLFGNSVNLFEVGGRAENLDQLLESLADGTGKSRRRTRNVSKGSAYLKVFGNELGYVTLDQMKAQVPRLDYLVEALQREQEIKWMQNSVFLDSSIIIPTVIGLPLKLAVNGSASMALKMKGHAELSRFLRTHGDMDIDGYLQPSGTVEIQGSMIVDAVHSKTGLKLLTRLHKSDIVEGKIKFERGKLVQFELGVPKEKMEIVNLDTKVFLLHSNSQQEQKGEQRTQEICSNDRFSKVTGIITCAHWKYPMGPYFPLSGSSSFDIIWEKYDSGWNKYIFEAKWFNSRNQLLGLFMLDTPGSKVNRKIDLKLDLKSYEKALVQVNTPWKKFSISGEYEQNLNKRKLAAKLNSDGAEYKVSTEMDYSPNEGFNGQIVLDDNGKEVFYWDGSVVYDKTGLVWDTMLKCFALKMPVTSAGRLTFDSNGKSRLDFVHSNEKFETELNGHAVRNSTQLGCGIDMEYKPRGGRRANIKKVNFETTLDTKRTGVVGVGKLYNTVYPQTNGIIFFEVDNPKAKETDIIFRMGKDSTDKWLQLTGHLNDLSTKSTREMKIRARIECPSQGIDYGTKVSHKQMRTSAIDTKIEFNQQGTKTSELWIKYLNDEYKFRLTGDGGFSHNGYHQQLKASIQEDERNSYKADLMWNGPESTDDDLIMELEWEKDKDIREFSCQIQFRDFDKLSAKGHVQLNRRLVDSALKWQKGTKKGTLSAHYSNTQSESSLKMQVECPKHFSRFYAGIKPNAEHGKLVFVDMNWNKNYRAKGEGKIGYFPLSITMEVDIDHDKYKIDGNFSRAYEENNALRLTNGAVELTMVDKKVSANFKTTKPIYPFQGTYRTDAKVQWDSGKAIEFLMKRVNDENKRSAKMQLKTPFDIVNLAEIEVNCNRRTEHQIGFKWRGDSDWIEGDIKGKRTTESRFNQYEGSVKTTSSFQGYEKLGFNYKFVDLSGAFQSEMAATINEDVYKMTANGEYTWNAHKMMVSSNLDLSTPFNKEFGVSFEHELSKRNGLKTILDITSEAGKISQISLTGSANNGKDNVAAGELRMYCPYAKRAFVVTCEHTNIASSDFATKCQYMTHDDGKTEHYKQVTVELSKMGNLNYVTTYAVVNFHDSNIRRNLGWKEIQISHTHDFNKVKMASSLALNSVKLAEIQLDKKQIQRMAIIETSFMWDIAVDEKFLVTALTSYKRDYVQLKISSTLTDTLVIKLTKADTRGKREVSTEVHYGKHKHELKGALIDLSHSKNSNGWGVQLHVQHPHNYKGSKQNKWKVEIENELIGRRSRDMNLHLETPIINFNKIDIGSRWVLEDLSEGELTHKFETKGIELDSKLQWFVQQNALRIVKKLKLQGMNLEAQINGEYKNRVGKGQLIVRESDKNVLDITVNGKFDNAKHFDGNLQMTSRYEPVADVQLYLRCRGTENFNVSLLRNSDKFEFITKVHPKGDGTGREMLDAILKTSLPNYREASLTCIQKNVIENVEMNCIVKMFNGDKIKLSGVGGDGRRLQLALETDYHVVNKWELIAEISQPYEHGLISFSWAPDRMVLLELKFKGRCMPEYLYLRFSSPFTHTKDIKLVAGVKQEGIAEFLVEYKGASNKVIKLSNILKISRTDISAQNELLLETPFYGWEQLEVKYKHKYEHRKQFNGKIEYFDYGRKQISFEIDHRPEYQQKKFSGYFKFYFPYKLHSVSKLAYEVEYEETVKTKVQWIANNRLIADIHVSLGNSGRLFDLYADNIFQPFEFKYLISGNDNGLQAESTFCWDRTQHQDSTVHIRGSIKADHLRRLRLKRGFSVTLAMPMRTVALKHDLDQAGGNFDHELEITWDLAKERKAGYHIQTKKYNNRREMKNTITSKVWMPVRTTEMEMKTILKQRQFKAELLLKPDLLRKPNQETKLTMEYDDVTTRHITAGHKIKFILADADLKHPLIYKGELSLNEKRHAKEVLAARSEFIYSNDPDKKIAAAFVLGFEKGQDRDAAYPVPLKTALFTLTHPLTNLDFELKGELSLPGWPFFVILGSTRLNQNEMEIEAVFDYNSEIRFLVKNNGKTDGIVGKCEKDRSSHIQNCHIKNTNGQPLGNLRITKEDVEITYYPKTSNDYRYKVHGKWHRRFMAIGAYHEKEDGSKLVDFDMEAQLVAPRKIDTRMSWRPTAVQEYQMLGRDVSTKMVANSQRGIAFALHAVFHEMNKHYKPLFDSISDETQPLVDEISAESATITKDYEVIVRGFKEAFRENDFYLDSLLSGFARFFNKISLFSSNLWHGYNLGGLLNDSIGWIPTTVGLKLNQAMRHIEGFLKIGDYRMVQTFRRVRRAVTYVSSKTYDMTIYYFSGFKNQFAQKYSYLRNHPIVLKTVDLTNGVSELFRLIGRWFYQSFTWLTRQMPWLVNNAVVENISNTLYYLDTQLTWMMKSLGLDKHFNEIMENFSIYCWLDELKDFFVKYIGLKDTMITVYDTNEGKLEAEIHLPVSLTSLKKLPKFKDLDEYQFVQKLHRRYRMAGHLKSYLMQIAQKEWKQFGKSGWLRELTDILSGKTRNSLETNRTLKKKPQDSIDYLLF